MTELVTGMDLVHLQIRIAAGEQLPFTQNDVRQQGHAIECRVYAEDPGNNFFPSPGPITALAEPSGPGIRLDSGVYEGWTVPVEYDPLLAKLVTYAGTRADAIARMRRAINEYVVGGVKTNLALFRQILENSDFIAGKTDTGYLTRHPFQLGDSREHEQQIAAIAAALSAELTMSKSPAPAVAVNPSAWKQSSRREGLR